MTTFVTSFFNLSLIEEDREKFRKNSFYIENGINLLSQPFNFIVFIDEDSQKIVEERMGGKRDNVTFITSVFQELPVFSILDKNTVTLPITKNKEKDTYNYMALMISKTHFIEQAILIDIYKTSHYTWIDFGYLYLCFGNELTDEVPGFLTAINNYVEEKRISIPGCIPPHVIGDYLNIKAHLMAGPMWWFCGGVFHGCKENLLKFNRLVTEALMVMKEQNVITWEINVWIYIYNKSPELFRWYYSDHNIGMIKHLSL
jgi:hypothetical protein